MIFYENLSVKFSFGYSRTNIWRGGGGALHGDVNTNTVTLSKALLCCVSVTSCAVFILRTAICVGQQYLGNTSKALLCCFSVTSCAVFILRTAICVGQQYLRNTLNFHSNSGNANAPQCYVVRTLHILLYM